jgi:polysaccharide export outer membrane protein
MVVALGGCALAPGIQLDGYNAVQRGRASTKDPHFKIHLIDSSLVQQLAAAERERAPAKLVDPLGKASGVYRYTIAPHDVLQVTVWDHPELTAPTGQFRSPEENGNPVDADGTVYYPHVGRIEVAGRTVDEVRDLLTERLARVVQHPQLDVRVAAFRGKRVQVTGEVTAPTTVPITDVPLHVQDALAAAKGFTLEADFSHVTLSRAGTTYALDLQAMYERGDFTQNWLLQDGDVINVADRSANKVFVLGEVRAQQSRLMVRGRMTLAEALMDPGGSIVVGTALAGFDLTASNPAKIYVIRGDFQAPQIYHLDASSPDAFLLATAFPLHPRDVVFVSTYSLARFSRVADQLLPTLLFLLQTYDVAVNAPRFLP